MRIIAGLLTVIMIFEVIVFQQTGVRTDATGSENRSVRLAAEQLLRNDSYAQRSRVQRMSDFARNLLGGKRSFEDYDLAIQIAVAQGNYSEALAFQEKALEVFEGTEEEAASQYLRMGYLYAVLGEYKRSLEWLNLGIEVTPYVEAVLTRAQVRLNLGDTAGAVQDATACLQTVGEDSALLPDMINIYEAAGAYETAVRLWTRVLENGEAGAYRLDRAYCLVQLGRVDEAEADVKQYLEEHGENAVTAYTMLGLGYLRGNEYERANACFDEALRGSETDPWSLYYYAVLCSYLTGDYERAREYGAKLIDRMRSGEATGAAEPGIEDVTGKVRVELKPVDFAQVCRMTGSSQLACGDYENAAGTLTLALEETDDPYVRYLRGTALLATDAYREALDDFIRAEAGGEDPGKCRYSAGVCRMRLGLMGEAIQDFTWVAENVQDEALREEAASQADRLRNGDETSEEPVNETGSETETEPVNEPTNEPKSEPTNKPAGELEGEPEENPANETGINGTPEVP